MGGGGALLNPGCGHSLGALAGGTAFGAKWNHPQPTRTEHSVKVGDCDQHVHAGTILLANFMTFLPEILREIMVILDRLGIITVTGSYDITGFVLRPPQWFSKIYHFLSNFNSSSQVWKWGILGFICGLARQYNDKYQHLYKRSQ